MDLNNVSNQPLSVSVPLSLSLRFSVIRNISTKQKGKKTTATGKNQGKNYLFHRSTYTLEVESSILVGVSYAKEVSKICKTETSPYYRLSINGDGDDDDTINANIFWRKRHEPFTSEKKKNCDRYRKAHHERKKKPTVERHHTID